MSSIIENIARGAQERLTGYPTQRAEAQDIRGGELIKQLATGGLAIGAGAGSVVALINYLRSLKEEAELEDESRLNDDTLYIPAPEKSAAEDPGKGVNSWLAPGLAVTGGILSGGAAYALTQKVYNYLEKKKRQRMLDEAQGEALAAADIEVRKAAAEKSAAKINFYDLITAFPVAVPLLAAIAAGGVSYAALKKTFPTVKAPKSKYPKRIRQVSQRGEVSDYDDEGDVLKSASVPELRSDADCEDAALEFLLMVTDQMSTEKRASIRLTSDVLNRVAKDGLQSVLSPYRDGGVEALVEVTKGASDNPSDMPNRALAAVAICKSARLRPVVAAIVAAEFQELAPAIYDSAVAQGEDHMDKMAGVASLMQLAFFRPQILEKSAMANQPLMEELQQLIDVPGVEEFSSPDEMEKALTTDAGGSLAEGSAEGETDEEMEGVADDDLNEEPEDPVDLFMEMEGKSPLLETED